MNERKRMNLYWKYVAEQNADELLKFFQVEQGKIIQLDEYWGDDSEIPEWRRNMKLGMPIL